MGAASGCAPRPDPPYHIFVRWKPLGQQPIGWNPDLNDGVRLNIRPFMQAGELRKRPNIKWGEDRGKNPPGSALGRGARQRPASETGREKESERTEMTA